jgi:hypothetical protein
MTEQRKRQTTVLCADEVWTGFQALANEQGKTLAVLLGEVVEEELVRQSSNEPETLAEPLREGTREAVPRELPPRTLIGFGRPVVRVR